LQKQPTKKAGAKPHRPSSSSLVYKCQYIRGQKHEAMTEIASNRDSPALISNSDNQYIDTNYVKNKCNRHILLNITKGKRAESLKYKNHSLLKKGNGFTVIIPAAILRALLFEGLLPWP
jgi:hypothetical protein